MIKGWLLKARFGKGWPLQLQLGAGLCKLASARAAFWACLGLLGLLGFVGLAWVCLACLGLWGLPWVCLACLGLFGLLGFVGLARVCGAWLGLLGSVRLSWVCWLAHKTFDELGPIYGSVFWSLDWVIPHVPSMYGAFFVLFLSSFRSLSFCFLCWRCAGFTAFFTMHYNF